MDATSLFRGRLRKRTSDGAVSKGPLVVRHPSPPAPSPSSSPAASPTLPASHDAPPREPGCSSPRPVPRSRPRLASPPASPRLTHHRYSPPSPTMGLSHSPSDGVISGIPRPSPIRGTGASPSSGGSGIPLMKMSPPSSMGGNRAWGTAAPHCSPPRAAGPPLAPTGRRTSPSVPPTGRRASPSVPPAGRRASPSVPKIADPSPAARGTSPMAGQRGASPQSSSTRGSSPINGSVRGSSPISGSVRGNSPISGGARGNSPGSRSSSGCGGGGVSEEVIRGRVRRALRARLYLLHQPGPNSFSVGGDSPAHKYRVIIGPQSCSCGHGPHCVHVLFVLVRVLQVPQQSPLLLASTLKDYEAEQLLGAWEERRKKAVRGRGESHRSPSRGDTPASHSRLNTSTTSSPTRNSPTSKGGSANPTRAAGGPNGDEDEEAQCPICLTAMVEGESLVACEGGCRNLLHHHCMAVWAADRHCQHLPLLCPLCRAPWPPRPEGDVLRRDNSDAPRVEGSRGESLWTDPRRSDALSGNPLRSEVPRADPARAEAAGGDLAVMLGPNHASTSSPSGGLVRAPSVRRAEAAAQDRVDTTAISSPTRELNAALGQLGLLGVRGMRQEGAGERLPHAGGGHGVGRRTRDDVSSFSYRNNVTAAPKQASNSQASNSQANNSQASNSGHDVNNARMNDASHQPTHRQLQQRPSLSSRHLQGSILQQHQHLQQVSRAAEGTHLQQVPRVVRSESCNLHQRLAASEKLPRPTNPPGSPTSSPGPSKSVPVIRPSLLPSMSAAHHRSAAHPPSVMSPIVHTSGCSGGYSGGAAHAASSHRRSSSVRSQSNPNSPYSPVDLSYPSLLFAHHGGLSGSNPRLSGRPRGSTAAAPPSRRSPSFYRVPDSASSAHAYPHTRSSSPLDTTPRRNLSSPQHVGRLLPPSYYPPTLRGEVGAVMVGAVGEDEVPLPRSEPIPPEHEDTAALWVAVFGRDLVACLFSRDWAVRETGLRRLAHEVVKVLHWDQLVTGEDTKKKVVHCCANVLAQVVNDPVYRVYLACLRVVRVLLSSLSLQTPAEVLRLQQLLRPLLHTLLLKCADGNRRTSQISVDSLLELSRGQEGELALGRSQYQHLGRHQLSSRHLEDPQGRDQPSSLGLGGVQYVLSCILDDSPPQEAPWQWLLGRLCVLDRLLDQFPEQFQIQMVSLQPAESGYKLEHYDRLMTVVEFAFKALGSSHATVAKLARRVYICGARMAAAEPSVFRHVCDMLGKLDISLQMRLKRRLRSLQGGGQRPPYPLMLGPDHQSIVRKLRLPVNAGTPYTSALPRLVRSVSHSPSRLLAHTLQPSPERVPPASDSRRGQSTDSPDAAGREGCHRDNNSDRNDPGNNHEDHDKSTTDVPPDEEPPQGGSSEAVTARITDVISRDAVTADATDDASSTKTSPRRPTHLPLDALQFSDKQARVRQYHRSRPRQEEPIIVQHALITSKSSKHNKPNKQAASGLKTAAGNAAQLRPGTSNASAARDRPNGSSSNNNCTSNNNCSSNNISSSNNGSNNNNENNAVVRAQGEQLRSPLLRRGGLSQSHGNNLDLSPRTPTGPPLLPNFTFKEAIASPSTPTAPFTTPVKDPSPLLPPTMSPQLQLCVDALTEGEEEGFSEPPLPSIPNLPLVPPYLAHDVGGSQERIAEETCDLYTEGTEWVRGPLLGSGAFSCCYQARDVATGALMAVKLVSFLRTSSEEQERVEAAVEEEILLMSQLRHRNLVRLVGSVRHASSFCVFTEWMAGGSVFSMLERYGAFSEPVILRYIEQVLRGLDYLHDNMILHRDLKGANLLVDSTGRWLRIGDFGTAARLASKATVTGEFQGQLLGTLAFMAPEVLRGDDYGRACDVWSIGCCLIEMATTKPPWDADHVSNQYKLMFKIATSNGPPAVPTRLSESTRALALQCLQICSEARPCVKQLLQHFSRPTPGPAVSAELQRGQTLG